MLISNAKLENIQQIGNSIVAESAENSGMLDQGELIVLVEGIQNEISLVEKLFPKPRRNASSSKHGGNGFNLFRTYEEAIDTFKNNPGSLVKYDPHELMVIDYHEQGNELEYDVTGDFIDIGRVLEGVPESFGKLHSGKARNRRVRIVANASQTCYMGQEEINKRSSRIIRLVNALEAHNFPVELISVDSCKCYHLENIVKKFNEPLVIEDVAIVTNSEYLRRLHFRVSEYSDTWFVGYGNSMVLDMNINSFRSEYNDELTVYIGNDMRMGQIDFVFDELETTVTEELSQLIPSICLIKAQPSGVTILEF